MNIQFLNLTSQTEAIQDINYEQSNIGDNPTINLATGRLQYAFADCSVGNGNFSIDVAHIYNSKINSAFAEKFTCFGNKWKLNLSQYMLVDSSQYPYMDETGEIHKFVYLDSNRMYEENNAKIILTKTSSDFIISDGMGNKKYFDADGYLYKSVSGQNSTMVKRYNYDAQHRLVSVYDERTVKNGLIKNKIELVYDNDGYLASMTAYANATKKISRYKYSYDSSGNLIGVYLVAYNDDSQELMSKQIAEFYYENNLLTMVINTEKDSAQLFTYEDGKISRISNGFIKEDNVATGMTDSEGAYIASGSYNNVGLQFGQTYVEKSYNTYTYIYRDNSDSIAVETDVSNECGITIAYFIDRLARITSSFEKAGTSLKTLNLQKERVGYSISTSSLGAINGNGIFNASTFSAILDPIRIIQPNYIPVQKSVSFSYSFWLKLNKTYELLEAQLSYNKTTDTSNVNVTKVYVNPQAVGAWQRVTLSIILDQVTVSAQLYSIKINFLSNGVLCNDSFQMCDIGYIAAPTTELCIRKEGNIYLPLRAVEMVRINGIDYNIGSNFFLSESDIISTYTAKRNNSTFDLIHNDGTKRISGVSSIKYYLVTDWSSYTGNSPFKIVMTLPALDSHCYSTYQFNNSDFSIENQFVKRIEDEEYTSMTISRMDYLGKTLSETDEYGVVTTNTYNQYGDLTRQFVQKGTTTLSAQHYSYDSEGRLLSVSDGVSGYGLAYDKKDNVKKITEKQLVDGTMSDTSRFCQNIQGVFNDKTVAMAEYCDNREYGRRKIEYEKGSIRTISDGVAKYGIQHDLLNNTVRYSQFDGNSEKNVQEDVVSEYVQLGDTYYQTHQSKFYNEAGILKDSSIAQVDCYGNITQKTQGNSSYSYTYMPGDESNFAKQVSQKSNPDGSSVEYVYSDEKDLVGWKEKTNNQTVFDVNQVSDSKTKYTYGNFDEEYFVELLHDKSKTAAPQLQSVIFQQDTNASHDQNASEIFRSEYTWNAKELTCVQDKKKSSTNGQFTNIAQTDYTYASLGESRRLVSAAYDNYKSNSSVRTTSLDTLLYYDNGLLKQESFSHNSEWERFSVIMKSSNISATRTYQYDNLHRLTKEINTALKIDRTYTYRTDGRLGSIGSASLTYDSRGRMTNYNGRSYTYDNYGNRTSKTLNGTTTNYTYKCGGILTNVGSTEYVYNADGIRYKKVTNGQSTRFYLDGNKILGEDRPNCKLRYFYDVTGLKMIRRIYYGTTSDYYCVKDSQGSIVMLVGKDRYIACRYEYDALGNCTILYDTDDIGSLNPFRWKGFYLDSESGLYYANGSYYDPETMSYFDAQDISSIAENAFETRGLDRNGIPCDNTFALEGNASSVFTSVELAPNPAYDPGQTWWEKITFRLSLWWNSISPQVKVGVGIVLIAISIVIAGFTGGASVGFGVAAAAAAKTALIDLAIGIGFATVGWVISSAISGNWDINGLGNAVADAIFFTGVFFFISTSVSAIKHAYRSKTFEIDGVEVQHAKKVDFTKESWNRKINLPKDADGNTISTMADGQFIHRGYKAGFVGKGKEYISKGVGRFDFYDKANKIIYELKPNNPASIAKGIKQLKGYNKGLGGGYKLVLVLY